MRNILLLFFSLIITVGLLLMVGFTVHPQSFSSNSANAQHFNTIPLPAGLPAPVERFYRVVYGDNIPMIKTVILQGRGTMKPFMNIPIPARFVFVHEAGQNYRHYFEATFFGIPVLKVNEGYINNKSFFESPMGRIYDDPNSNQGANLALWAEATWFPSLWITDPRSRWESVDENTALLYIPFEDIEENFVVRFDPQTGLIDTLEAMRYRDPGDEESKILWITRNEKSPLLAGTNINSIGSVMWLDQGKPWAFFAVEEMIFNADVSTYIQQKGR